MKSDRKYVGRAGMKLEFAIGYFGIDITDKICADFGSNIGGFVDCLLGHRAKKVYAVETGYGVLDWKLRKDPRVVVMERTNAMHVALPEKVDVITIDTSWTTQKNIIPNALKNLKNGGVIISLVKSHYEYGRKLKQGKLDEDKAYQVAERVVKEIETFGLQNNGLVKSPLVGRKGENLEFLAYFIQNTF